ncbi:unnamed protein product [Pedinophyceae sp. YPF-701]|nr:unnamed protein product [Pedinophyceae sp. YPF-701]
MGSPRSSAKSWLRSQLRGGTQLTPRATRSSLDSSVDFRPSDASGASFAQPDEAESPSLPRASRGSGGPIASLPHNFNVAARVREGDLVRFLDADGNSLRVTTRVGQRREWVLEPVRAQEPGGRDADSSTVPASCLFAVESSAPGVLVFRACVGNGSVLQDHGDDRLGLSRTRAGAVRHPPPAPEDCWAPCPARGLISLATSRPLDLHIQEVRALPVARKERHVVVERRVTDSSDVLRGEARRLRAELDGLRGAPAVASPGPLDDPRKTFQRLSVEFGAIQRPAEQQTKSSNPQRAAGPVDKGEAGAAPVAGGKASARGHLPPWSDYAWDAFLRGGEEEVPEPLPVHSTNVSPLRPAEKAARSQHASAERHVAHVQDETHERQGGEYVAPMPGLGRSLSDVLDALMLSPPTSDRGDSGEGGRGGVDRAQTKQLATRIAAEAVTAEIVRSVADEDPYECLPEVGDSSLDAHEDTRGELAQIEGSVTWTDAKHPTEGEAPPAPRPRFDPLMRARAGRQRRLRPAPRPRSENKENACPAPLPTSSPPRPAVDPASHLSPTRAVASMAGRSHDEARTAADLLADPILALRSSADQPGVRESPFKKKTPRTRQSGPPAASSPPEEMPLPLAALPAAGALRMSAAGRRDIAGALESVCETAAAGAGATQAAAAQTVAEAARKKKSLFLEREPLQNMLAHDLFTAHINRQP